MEGEGHLKQSEGDVQRHTEAGARSRNAQGGCSKTSEDGEARRRGQAVRSLAGHGRDAGVHSE